MVKKKSKLESYEEIIRILAKRALALDDLAFQCNMNCSTLQQRLDSLFKQNIVSIEVCRDNRTFYVLSKRGASIAKTFRLAKRLEKLQISQREEQRVQTIAAYPDEQQQKLRRAW